MKTQREDGHLHGKEKGLRRNHHCCHVLSNFQPLELWEDKFLCCKLPSLWHLVMPALWHSYRTALQLISDMVLLDFDLYIFYLISSSPLPFEVHYSLYFTDKETESYRCKLNKITSFTHRARALGTSYLPLPALKAALALIMWQGGVLSTLLHQN